jgi:hypothetical protein
MKQFITDTNIINNVSKDVLDTNPDNPLTERNVLTLLPKIITYMESNYRSLLGSTKKELVISIVLGLMQLSNCDEQEIENIKIILPDLIDSLVTAFNSTSKFFKKNKKCCFPVKRRR